MDKKTLLWRMNNIDMETIEVVTQLKNDFIEWCKWNKAYPCIELFESKEFYGEIIVIHNLFDETKIENGWEFLSDIQEILDDYSNYSKEDCNYMIDFWKERLNGLLEVSI